VTSDENFRRTPGVIPHPSSGRQAAFAAQAKKVIDDLKKLGFDMPVLAEADARAA